MRYSYLEPNISDIAHTVNASQEAVFYQLRKIKERIASRCEPVLSAVGNAVLIGIRHPVDGFDRFQGDRREQINQAIRRALSVRPFKEQFVFYMRYSPLAVSPDLLAGRLREDQNTVRAWLASIEGEIRGLCQA